MPLALSEHRGQLSLDLVPGKRAGPFILGAPVGHMVRLLQTAPHLMPQVDCKYPEDDPLATDWVLGLHHAPPPPTEAEAGTESSGTLGRGRCGTSLLFEPTSQRLRAVVIHNPSLLRLTYRSTECQSNKTIATGLLINRIFGPTHPGTFRADTGVFTLHYPGISFEFAIPERHRGLFSQPGDGLPLEFPDGTTPPCSCIYLYHGVDWSSALPPSPLTYAAVYRALTDLPSVTFATDCRGTLNQGLTTAQDLVADLGQPETVFYKNDDKMSIHAPGTPDEGHSALGRDYFFNYYEMGFDVLLDGKSHRCKKIVLHGNIPGHYDFGRYRKCEFQLDLAASGKLAIGGTVGQWYLTTGSDWKSISNIVNTDGQPPVVFSRGSSDQNPFGSTLFYGQAGIIFEIMKNDSIPTFTLF
ncbi:hypothetical protein BJ085DRAFT_21321 [Dimargaris cristalligena]|uniref:Uncharacterized protein n=1 Tax=Dimargaris cristalligena TaxID=215637 RepID=A0A4P9ZMH2_9FUNG|nr:hypothetical protein BJ085DRAFT_21321 [Dimargaris cristalligena]|eukprot:RKP34477.1 hypothetical protein BJ085DRAFT_21321 [Dimargaris cristalligena]